MEKPSSEKNNKKEENHSLEKNPTNSLVKKVFFGDIKEIEKIEKIEKEIKESNNKKP